MCFVAKTDAWLARRWPTVEGIGAEIEETRASFFLCVRACLLQANNFPSPFLPLPLPPQRLRDDRLKGSRGRIAKRKLIFFLSFEFLHPTFASKRHCGHGKGGGVYFGARHRPHTHTHWLTFVAGGVSFWWQPRERLGGGEGGGPRDLSQPNGRRRWWVHNSQSRPSCGQGFFCKNNFFSLPPPVSAQKQQTSSVLYLAVVFFVAVAVAVAIAVAVAVAFALAVLVIIVAGEATPRIDIFATAGGGGGGGRTLVVARLPVREGDAQRDVVAYAPIARRQKPLHRLRQLRGSRIAEARILGDVGVDLPVAEVHEGDGEVLGLQGLLGREEGTQPVGAGDGEALATIARVADGRVLGEVRLQAGELGAIPAELPDGLAVDVLLGGIGVEAGHDAVDYPLLVGEREAAFDHQLEMPLSAFFCDRAKTRARGGQWGSISVLVSDPDPNPDPVPVLVLVLVLVQVAGVSSRLPRRLVFSPVAALGGQATGVGAVRSLLVLLLLLLPPMRVGV
jgi:hypothetical protein